MPADKLNRFWLLATFLLIVIILTGSLIIRAKQDNGQPVTISDPPSSDFNGDIYIDGAVSNPGVYPLKNNDSLISLIQASGGINEDADLSRIHLYIPQINEGAQPQKIDINRAEIWLLEALPDIGKVRAQAIIDYRQQNGPFRNIGEIARVPGINSTTFEKIKRFITVNE
jgi:competence protein ComEA